MPLRGVFEFILFSRGWKANRERRGVSLSKIQIPKVQIILPEEEDGTQLKRSQRHEPGPLKSAGLYKSQITLSFYPQSHPVNWAG